MLDPFMITLGLQGEVPRPGQARVGHHPAGVLNSWGSAHGGFLYAVADAAFALASNSHGTLAVALAAHMEYLQASQAGAEVEALATEGSPGTTHGGLSGRGAQRIDAAGALHRNGLPADRAGQFAVGRPVTTTTESQLLPTPGVATAAVDGYRIRIINKKQTTGSHQVVVSVRRSAARGESLPPSGARDSGPTRSASRGSRPPAGSRYCW